MYDLSGNSNFKKTIDLDFKLFTYLISVIMSCFKNQDNLRSTNIGVMSRLRENSHMIICTDQVAFLVLVVC